MKIQRALLDEIVAHAVRDAPNECCGIVAAQDGTATLVHAVENQAASPYRFEVDGLEMFRLLEQIESQGGELGAIYHSHTRSEPYPSQTDVNFSHGWPGSSGSSSACRRTARSPRCARTSSATARSPKSSSR